jgi:hypothetical protein
MRRGHLARSVGVRLISDREQRGAALTPAAAARGSAARAYSYALVSKRPAPARFKTLHDLPAGFGVDAVATEGSLSSGLAVPPRRVPGAPR